MRHSKRIIQVNSDIGLTRELGGETLIARQNSVITIPPDEHSIEEIVYVFNAGAFTVSINAGVGVTLLPGNVTVNTFAILKKIGDNEWIVFGDLA